MVCVQSSCTFTLENKNYFKDTRQLSGYGDKITQNQTPWYIFDRWSGCKINKQNIPGRVCSLVFLALSQYLVSLSKAAVVLHVSILRPTSYTLFSECLVHEYHPNFLKSLGHRHQPRVIFITQQCSCTKGNLMDP